MTYEEIDKVMKEKFLEDTSKGSGTQAEINKEFLDYCQEHIKMETNLYTDQDGETKVNIDYTLV